MTLQERVVAAIDRIIADCDASQRTAPDAVVDGMLKELNALRAEVEVKWPLPAAVKARIIIGRVAAKNLDDWNEPLATSLMILDTVLSNDGASLSKLIGDTRE